MNVLQHTRNELNLCHKENRPDRSYRVTLLITLAPFFVCDAYNEENDIAWALHSVCTMYFSSRNFYPLRRISHTYCKIKSGRQLFAFLVSKVFSALYCQHFVILTHYIVRVRRAPSTVPLRSLTFYISYP